MPPLCADPPAPYHVKHNAFVNSYAVISTDGVSGNDLLVFGNVFALQEIPGARCLDEGWCGAGSFSRDAVAAAGAPKRQRQTTRAASVIAWER